MAADSSRGRGGGGGTERLPSLGAPGIWGLGLLLAASLYILGLQIDQLIPGMPGWGRTFGSFILTGTLGEFFVYHRWPSLRMSPADSREVSIGYLTVALVISAVVGLVELLWGIVLPPGPLAWVAYISLVLLDASYRW